MDSQNVKETLTRDAYGRILKPDGQIDYAATVIEFRAHPPKVDTPQSLAADIARLNFAERERINKIVRVGGWAAVQREKDLGASADRRAAEERGKAATLAESKRLAASIAERKAAQESVIELFLDPVTDERVTHRELMLRNITGRWLRLRRRLRSLYA
jgi:hypothetical protein